VAATRTYPVLGGVAGAAVTAAFWFTLTVSWWFAIPTLIGAMAGSALGYEIGNGNVKEEWSGWFGAVVMPAVVIALANGFVLLYIASRSP
jgi:hypothetical protein